MPKQEFKMSEEMDAEHLERERENAERREQRKLKDQRRRDVEDYVSQVSRPRPR